MNDIVDKIELTKEECDHLLFLFDLIEKFRKNSQNYNEDPFYFRIPSNIFSSKFSISEIISDLEKLENAIGRKITVNNNSMIIENYANDLLLKKISEKQIKEEINLIKNKIVEIPTVLKKEPETETKPKIRIDLRGYIFIKDQQENGMKVGDKKLEILRVLSDKKPKTMFQIAEMVKYKDDRRVVPAITEINNSIKKLTGGSDLIINLGAGYCFNTSNLLISFINKK